MILSTPRPGTADRERLSTRQRLVASGAIAVAVISALVVLAPNAHAFTASVGVLILLPTGMYFRIGHQERALRQRSRRQAALLQAQSDLGEMLLVEEEGRLTSWNQAAIEMTGLSGDELAEIGSLDELFLDPGDHLGRLSRGARMELQLRGSAGPGPWVELARQALPDESGSLVIARDITQRRALQGELVQRATHDPLTGLPNRALFEDRIAHATAARKRRGGSFSVLALDLDQFKSVNDMLGHHAGDELLVEVGRRLMTVLREQDMVARLGGDELALLVEDADEASAEIVVRRIGEALEPSFVMQGHELRVSASIGIAVAPNDGEDPDVLLRRADMAMYEAKQQRGSHRFYDRALEERMLAQVTVVTELRRALEEGQFDLHYQPKISARTGQVAGIEALVRWQHPTRGLLEPADFVPHAVRARLGRGLDAWVLRNALVAARTWQRMGLSLPVSVNVGAETVEDPEFVDLVRTTLRTVGVDPRSLVLELTEDATLSDPRRIGELLRGLTAEGVQVSIDDFGTGYSSLLSVQHLPATELKIDRAFVRDLRTSPADQKIVRASTALARSLGMTATAEGVEDQETWDLLRELGCEQGQGYLFARPLPMPELVAWLLDRSSELDQDAIRRYADRLLQLAEPSEAMSSSERSASLEEEREGIRAIMAWAIGARETELALALSAGLRRYWCDAGRLDEASHWLGSALAAASDEGDTSAEATIDALNGLGVVLGQRGDLTSARALLEGCVDAARAIGADATLTRALTDLGVATAALGDLETAERCGVEAASLLGRAGQRVAEARQWNNIAVIRYRRGDHAAARELLDRALNVLGGQAEQRYLPDVLDTLGAVAIAEGDLGAAWHAYGRSLRLYRHHGVAGDITQPMIGIAVLVSGVRADLALRLMGAAEGIHARRGSQHSLLEDLLPWIRVRMERQLGEAACADELLRGRGLASDAAIDLGLACYAEEAPQATTERPDPAALEREPFVGSLIA